MLTQYNGWVTQFSLSLSQAKNYPPDVSLTILAKLKEEFGLLTTFYQDVLTAQSRPLTAAETTSLAATVDGINQAAAAVAQMEGH